MIIGKLKMYAALAIVVVAGSINTTYAKPNVEGSGRPPLPRGTGLRGTAALCDQATANVDLDINNVRANLMNGGDMWWDRGSSTAKYEVPKGSGKNSLFAGSIWVGGYDEQNNLKVCAQTYRQNGGNDYWPGPLDLASATIDKADCSEWDKFWKINKSDVLAFNELIKSGIQIQNIDPKYKDIIQWPAAGNTLATGKGGVEGSLSGFLGNKTGINTYAPFIDANGNGKYEPGDGDYPDIFGDQYIWWVFNDAGGVKTETETGNIGMEVQTSAFAYSTKNYLNDATFYNYRLINRGTLNLTKTYMATWTDADLGYAFDDYIGCDTARSLGVLYNSKTPDGNGEPTSYGSQVPMVGVDFFIGPKLDTFIDGQYKILDTLGMTVFNYFDNDQTATGNPNGGVEIYRLITGFNRVGAHIQFDGINSSSTGYGPGPITNFVYPGNPNNTSEWSQCACQSTPKDRRFVHSSGPFTLYAGGIVNDITIGAVWVADVGGCGTGTFSRIRAADDLAQTLFNDKFRALQGPDAPDMTIREGDRELIVYLTNNNPASNNYKEGYGRDTGRKFRESTSLMRRYADSLYKFEGYRVFQLKNSSITAAQIFGQNGLLDTRVAAEVFQTDIKNGVSKIINYTNNPDAGAGIFSEAIKVNGKDSGLVHSFRITQDAFAVGSNKTLVNYKTYYFIAVAYGYNNYRPFVYNLSDSTQNSPYIESSLRAGGLPNTATAVVPNPTNGAMGTTIGANYGDGVDIQRLEGLGNGRYAIEMNQESENMAIANPNYQAVNPVYKAGTTPIVVNVVDPRKLQAMDYEVWLTGPVATDGTRGIVDSLGTWSLRDKATGAVLYSESNLSNRNDLILANYGVSVTIQQGRRPGDNEPDQNGYITSSILFTDPGKLWLSGVNDNDGITPTNWIQSGNQKSDTSNINCSYKDNSRDTFQFYEKMFRENDLVRSSWAPYGLASNENQSKCGYGVQRAGSNTTLTGLQSVDVVFTSDKSKWTHSPVIELNDDINLSENRGTKYLLRRHASWDMNVDGSGNPVYSTNPSDTGMSWFPGYAVSQSTGERLNIVFGEDSYLKNDHGNDMIWNPTSTVLDNSGNVIFGGKHYVYILNSKYDEGKTFVDTLKTNGTVAIAYRRMMWVGLPTLTPGFNLLSINDGLIPTETRLKFRVESPYRRQADTSVNVRNSGLPIFGFSTKGIAPKPLTDGGNQYNNDKQALLDRIRVVPNPYYGYTGYERNRLDTRVKFTNLPNRATITIYSLDGTLIRKIEHVNSEATTQGYEDWDIRNMKGLQIASGMYLIHVKAEGIGETVIKWFGAMRPTDVTTY